MSRLLNSRVDSFVQVCVAMQDEQADVPYAIRALRNAGRIARAGSVDALFGRFPGAPIVIACGGPSLERNLEELRPWRERVVLIAEAAAAGTLVSSDIMPDFVVAF